MVKCSAFLRALRGYFSCQKVQDRNQEISQHTRVVTDNRHKNQDFLAAHSIF